MKTISSILKFFVFSLFNLNQVRWGKTIWQKLKPFGKFFLILYVAGAQLAGYWLALSQFSFVFRLPLIRGLVINVIITAGFLSLFLLNIASSGQMIFNGKEMPRWFVLPVKNRDVLIGKTAILYIGNLLLLLLIMLPLFYTLNKVGKLPAQNLMMGLAAIVAIPILPILPGVLINLAINLLIVRRISLTNRKTVVILLPIVLFIGIFLISFSMSDQSTFVKVFHLLNQLAKANKLIGLVTAVILRANWMALFTLIALSLAGFTVYLLYFSPRLTVIYEQLNKSISSNKKTAHQYRQTTPVQALLRKDLGMFFINAGVAVNIFSGMIMVLFLNVFLIFRKDLLNTIFPFLEMTKTSPTIIAIIMLNLLFAMTTLTPATLSLEGVHFPMLKNYPVTTRTIFFYKWLLAVLVNWVGLLLNLPLLIYNFGLSLNENLLTIFVVIGFSLFFPMMGLIINLWLPKFDWTNPVVCVKQSFSTFIAILLGLAITFIPLLLLNQPIPFQTMLILLGIMAYLLTIGLWGYLIKWGVRRFNRL